MSVIVGLGTGLAASLALSEILAIAPGGYVVPGYLALNLDQPARVAATIGVALVTLLVMRLAARYVILYGMRRFVLYLLVGFTLGVVYAVHVAQNAHTPIQAIGFIVPATGEVSHDNEARRYSLKRRDKATASRDLLDVARYE